MTTAAGTINNNNSNNNENAWAQINQLCKLTADDVEKVYDSWANSYNEDNQLAKYLGPKIGAFKLAELVAARHSRVLDCACGTGLVGRELQDLGYKNLVGVDCSEKSLEIAEREGIYESLHAVNVMTGALPFENDSFDAIVSVGTFIPGHVDQTVFPEFLRVVKPGGVIMIVMRERYIATGDSFKGGKLDSAIVKLADAGQWNYLYRQRIPGFIEGYAGIAFALQIC